MSSTFVFNNGVNGSQIVLFFFSRAVRPLAESLRRRPKN